MEVLFRYINQKSSELENSDFNFQSIFKVIHNQDDRIFAEYIEMFEVKTVSYEQMKQYCHKMATHLKKQINNPTGTFVGLYMENCVDWVAVFWALLMIGYKPLLLNCRLSNDINKQVVKTMNCNLVITNRVFAQLDLGIKTVVLADTNSIEQEPILQEENWADEMALCTTASSLNYKICVYTGKNMTHQLLNAKDIISHWPRIKKHYKHRLKQLTFLPFYHIFGFVATLMWFSMFGRTMVFLPNYSAEKILYTIRRCEVTHIFAIPMFWNSIAKEISKQINRQSSKLQKKFKIGQKLALAIQNIFPNLGVRIARKLFRPIIENSLGNSIKCLISGGSYIPHDTLYLLNSIGYPLVNGYGSTEIGIICVDESSNAKNRIKGLVGKPLKSINVKIEDEHLHVCGQSTCSYVFLKDGTKQELNGNNWYDTRDLASFVKNKISIYGRDDDVIMGASGEKINPDLIEGLFSFTSILNYVVLNLNSKVTLVIQTPVHLNVYKLKDILQEVDKNVNKATEHGYIIESILYTTDSITPVNAVKVSRTIFNKMLENQKIVLHELSELKENTNAKENNINNDVTITIKNIFAEVLDKDVSVINNNDHFFLDLGGTSLDYCTCLVRIQNEYDLNIDMSDKRCMTINDFSQYILDRKGGKYE